jgi:hypothetical protein
MLTVDVSRLYRWSTTYLWEEKISRILLRFVFLVCILKDKVVLRFGDFERTSCVLSFSDFERTSFGP